MPGTDIEQLTEILNLILDQLKVARQGERELAAGTKAWPSLAEIEGVYVGHVLRHTRGNKQKASRILNVDRKTLDRMIKRHQIELE
jgi:DNA-binding NtrC family response regulator